MNLRKFVPVLAVSALLLTGCGAKNVSYAEFHDAALAVEKHSYTSASVVYTEKSDSADVTKKATLKYGLNVGIGTLNTWTLDEGDSVVGAAAIALIAANAGTVGEDEKYTYTLDGKNFKVQYSENSYDYFESHGLVTEHVVGVTKYAISYK